MSTTVALDATIPSTTTIFSGSSFINSFMLQADCDCMVQFVKGNGTTKLTGPIHLQQYEITSLAAQGEGVFISDDGFKIIVSGNTSGNIRGFFTTHST
jgi:hypothetical protein